MTHTAVTPAEKAGLKIGDKIRVISTLSAFTNSGDILIFSEDDRTEAPWFNHEDPSCIIDGIGNVAFNVNRGENDNKWEKVIDKPTQRFSNMKFNIGDDPQLAKSVQETLFASGYKWLSGGMVIQYTDKVRHLFTNISGDIFFREASDGDTYFSNCTDNYEEINIDWMRTYIEPVKEPVQETITIGDRTYIKSELEAALANINPVGS